MIGGNFGRRASDRARRPAGTCEMNTNEAGAILTDEIGKYEQLSYDQLRSMVGAPKRSYEVVAGSGVRYYIDVRAMWDDKPSGDVRVMVSIDAGGWGAYSPLTAD